MNKQINYQNKGFFLWKASRKCGGLTKTPLRRLMRDLDNYKLISRDPWDLLMTGERYITPFVKKY